MINDVILMTPKGGEVEIVEATQVKNSEGS
jgi:hypothetical protein